MTSTTTQRPQETLSGPHFTTQPLTTPSDAAKRSMSSYAYRKEFMASFAAQGSDIFKKEWINILPENPNLKKPEGPYDPNVSKVQGDYYIAVDLAGFEKVGGPRGKGKSRLDNSAIAVVWVGDDGKWFVEKIIWGRWDLKETAQKIFHVVRKYEPKALGIEKGIAQQAVMSPLEDMMRKHNRFFTIKLCTHGNKKKSDRIIWALQGRFENGFITLKEDSDWNGEFLDELFQFPSSLVHDDLPDALSFIDQLIEIGYNTWEEEEDYAPVDIISGY
jgi:predicted phage terminase large subunit-like protein